MGDRRIGWTGILFAMAIALAGATANATDRFFFDSSATSPNGRFTLTATSPDNAGERPKPFARNFEYVLTDNETGEVVYRRTQDRNERSPMALHLHDDGAAAIYTARESLLFQDATGQIKFEFSILDQFPKKERRRYVQQTSARLRWGALSRWYFLEHDNDLYFVIHTGWGRRVIADVRASRLVDPDEAELIEPCRLAERRLAVEKLRRAAAEAEDRVRSQGGCVWLQQTASTSAFFAGGEGWTEAIPSLRVLERLEIPSFTRKLPVFAGDLSTIMSHPTSPQSHGLRQISQMALRMLGEEPAPLPGTWLSVRDAEGKSMRYLPPELPAPRLDRIDLIAEGMGTQEVIEAIGPPDTLDDSRSSGSRWPVWEYHFDSPEPFTLRVAFSEEGAVSSVKRQTPPLWMDRDALLERMLR